MRNRLAALFGVWFSMAASPADCALWSVEHDALMWLERGDRVQVALFSDAATLSPTSDGGTWLTAADGLWSLSREGEVRVHVDLVARGLGNGLKAAADPYDGSAWIATDASLLLHIASDGSLVHGTTIAAPATALAIDLDHSLWLIANGELTHWARDGKWLGTRALHLTGDESATALAIDALRNQAWIETTHGVYRLPTHGDSTSSIAVRGRETAALALDPRSGIVLAIVDRSLVALESSGNSQPGFDRLLEESEQPLALLYDTSEATFIIGTTHATLHVASDGRVLERGPARVGAILAAAPFRIEPALTLLRPPNGGAITDYRTEIVLRIAARCNATPCETPPAYLPNVHVDGALDGIPLGEARIDVATGRATFPQRPTMTPGLNRLTARAVDAFGHDVTLDGARWTVLAPAAIAVGTAPDPSSSERRSDKPSAKAANKPPTVSLTSPASADVYSVGTAITLAATATDVDGSIAKVEFYRGGTTLIGTATTAPYRYAWASAAAGNYSLTAKAYDNKNGTAISAPVTIVVANNQLPAVTLTSPAAGSFFAAGSTVRLAAGATDPDGTIASVEFVDAGTSIGVAAGAPYEVMWNASSPGVHTISARATDNRGGMTESAVVDIVVGEPPVVVVTGPAACSIIDGPLDVVLSADVMGTGGKIVSVEFFDGGSLVGTANAAPWRTTLVNASAGSHSITAKATDDHGLTTASRSSTFTIRAANQSPTVALTSPIEGTRFAYGSVVNLSATASDADGTVTAVEFRLGSAGGTVIGRATNSPYTAAWTNIAAGSYAVVAVAYDDRNATTTSGAVHITIDANVLPIVTLTSPASNASYSAPANIPVSASASDSDGSITKVEFYAGTVLVGSSNAAPYTTSWSNVGAGAYSITAKATDNAGGVTTSSAVPITVASNALPTVALTAPAAGGQYFAPATITLSANAADGDGTIVMVDFYANGSLIGTAAGAPYSMVWDAITAGTYSLAAKATDNAGGTTTSSPLSITVNGAPAINIDAALDGATIGDDNVLVRGFVSAPGNAAVTVNGIVTHIDDYGRFQANDVPLTPGANAVTAVVTAQDGQTTSQTITVNSTGPGAFRVHASPTEGLNLLQVAFTVENPGNISFKQINFDLDNDGFPNVIATPNQFVDGALTVTATYPAGTWLAVIKVYDDQDHVIYSTSKSIVVLLPSVLQGNLRAIYDGMLSRLRAGNIPGALTAFTGAAYDKYSAIFTRLQPTLASIVDQIGEIREVNFGMDLAEFSVVRNTPDGPKRFMFYLIRAEDGIWRIDGM